MYTITYTRHDNNVEGKSKRIEVRADSAEAAVKDAFRLPEGVQVVVGDKGAVSFSIAPNDVESVQDARLPARAYTPLKPEWLCEDDEVTEEGGIVSDSLYGSGDDDAEGDEGGDPTLTDIKLDVAADFKVITKSRLYPHNERTWNVVGGTEAEAKADVETKMHPVEYVLSVTAQAP